MKRRLLAAIGLVVAVVLVLNIAGIVRYPGGPLRDANADGVLWLDLRPAGQGNSSVGNTADADWAQTNQDLVYSSIFIPNSWPWPATIERITPLDVSGTLIIREVLVRRPDVTSDPSLLGFGLVTPDQRAILDADYTTLPATVGPSEPGRLAALVLRSATPGTTGFESLAIDYRVGPFSFRIVQHIALHACLGTTPAERICPEASSP